MLTGPEIFVLSHKYISALSREGFAKICDWSRRAHQEIRDFEGPLMEGGVKILATGGGAPN